MIYRYNALFFSWCWLCQLICAIPCWQVEKKKEWFVEIGLAGINGTNGTIERLVNDKSRGWMNHIFCETWRSYYGSDWIKLPPNGRYRRCFHCGCRSYSHPRFLLTEIGNIVTNRTRPPTQFNNICRRKVQRKLRSPRDKGKWRLLG